MKENFDDTLFASEDEVEVGGDGVFGPAAEGSFSEDSSAEDEEACLRVGWKPYHVREGFNLNESTITLSSTLLWGNNMASSTTDPQKIMELMAWDISERSQFALGSGRQFTFRTVLMTEPVAATIPFWHHYRRLWRR